ncbi:MAG: MerR family transcriptional regulator [Telmatospirillum sp.]|nr:MerR family transcriptional regulator [Telmatospirillum sp.]
MRIGELARRSGLTASRIRFYEAVGLVRPAARRANGYRDYPGETVWILEIITIAQRAGFSLEEIRPLLPTQSDHWRRDQLLDALKRKVVEIEAMQKRLDQNRTQLLIAIEGIETAPDGIGCSDLPERLLNRLKKEKEPAEMDTAREGGAPALRKTGRVFPAEMQKLNR